MLSSWDSCRDAPAIRPCVWLHAVSAGEVNVLQPLVERLRHDFPHCDCVISTTTRTGYEIATKKFAGLTRLLLSA